MISDNYGNLLLMGSPEIKIPEKMFFMAKNGKVREAPTTTKNGALSMRGGVRSIKLIPSGDKVEIIKLGETLEEFRKRQSKKEAEDLLSEMIGTKTNKKIEIPELPEPKKKERVKKEPEPEPEPEPEDNRYFSDYLDIERVNKESGVQPEEMKIYNVMYDLLDNYFKTNDVKESFKKIKFSLDAQEYITTWLDKKKEGQTELSDFVKLVIYPRLKKDNKEIDNITLLLYGLSIAIEFKKYIDLYWTVSKSQFNSYRVWKIFNQGKISGVHPVLINKIKGYKRAFGDLLDYKEGPQAARKYREPEPKPKPKPEPENEDIISGNLQKLIYTSSIDKIKKALEDLKYKGRIQTNKVMLNMQLLQNLDINKQKELIKLLQ